jgi:hypothetical protein
LTYFQSMKTNLFLLALLSISGTAVLAQNNGSFMKGHFNGSFENYSQYYLKDIKIDALPPDDKFGMNSFLKLDYNYDKFTAGVQFESYLPPILGFYPVPFDDQSKLVNKYFKYADKKFSIQVGDFYEQFGSGMIFRAYENRQIGINNALEGANVYVEPTNFMKLKVIYGRTRKLFEYTNSNTRGADAEFDLTRLINPTGEKNNSLSLGGSFVSRYQEYTGPIDNYPTTVNAYAGRAAFQSGDFDIEAEYVEKGADPHLLNNESLDKGRSLQVNTTLTKNNFGATLTYRTLYNMNYLAEREGEFASIGPVNYVPALTKQHDYLTSNIYVYAAQFKGETGGQLDLYYRIKPKTALGGKYGMLISFNISHFSGLGDTGKIFSKLGTKYYSDINLEIKKKFSPDFEATLAAQHIFYNSAVIQAVSEANVDAYIVALSGLYKFAPQKSLRCKFEHLSTKTDRGNWVSGIAEFSMSSPYTFFISDLYNYGKSDAHYYNVGASVTKKANRFSLSFGKQRAGLFCVGGICRFVPASFGFTASLTSTFSN